MHVVQMYWAVTSCAARADPTHKQPAYRACHASFDGSRARPEQVDATARGVLTLVECPPSSATLRPRLGALGACSSSMTSPESLAQSHSLCRTHSMSTLRTAAPTRSSSYRRENVTMSSCAMS